MIDIHFDTNLFLLSALQNLIVGIESLDQVKISPVSVYSVQKKDSLAISDEISFLIAQLEELILLLRIFSRRK